MSVRNTAEVAAELRISRRKVTQVADRLGVGMVIGGSAGRRYDEDDVQAIKDALRPAPQPVQVRPRRRRRRLAGAHSP